MVAVGKYLVICSCPSVVSHSQRMAYLLLEKETQAEFKKAGVMLCCNTIAER
jgi:hypothetical protein